MQIATLSVLTGSFTLITAFWNVSTNLNRILADWGEQAQMTVYLKDEIEMDETGSLEGQLKGLTGVSDVTYTSKSQAYATFVKHVKDYAPSIAQGEDFESALPASFELKFADDAFKNAERYDFLKTTAQSIRAFNKVQDVSYGQGWVENYASFLAGVRAVGLALIIMLTLGGLFVVANSIHTSVSQRREEIEILELIGATSNMIRRPYIFEGASLGFGAAVFSLVLNYFLYLGQLHLVQTNWAFMGLATQIQYVTVWQCLVVLTVGSLVGALGSYFTVNRINSGWAAADRLR